jgi:catechol 2,3-dioxygenase-like lactoylglutathione lyase family enzyme
MITFAHTNIITDDWRRLADFYIKVFGCLPLYPERDLMGMWLDNATTINGAHISGIHLALPGYDGPLPTLEIFQYDSTIQSELSQPNRKGFGHIAFKVDQIDEILELVLANGGTAVGELVKTEIPNVGFITFIYVRDNDGNIIELQNWKDQNAGPNTPN